jgi:Icc-related predicted phosphoesterase
MRIFAVSDLLTDFAENRRRLQQVSSTAYLQDAVVVAGDIADNLKIKKMAGRDKIRLGILSQPQ